MNQMDQPSTRNFDLFKVLVAVLLVAIIAFLLMQSKDADEAIVANPTSVPTAVPTVAVEPTEAPTAAVMTAVAELMQPEVASDGALKLSGKGQPGAALDILASGTSIGTTKVASNGSWTHTAQLEPGDYDLTVNTLDAAGKIINQSKPLAFTMPALTPPSVAAMPQFSQPQIGEDGLLALSGTGEPKSTLDILASGQSLGSAAVGDDGAWNFSTQLEPGDYDLVVRTLNADGTIANETLPVAISVPASTQTVAVPELDRTEVSNEGVVSLGGRAQPGARLSVMVNDSRLGRTTADDSGAWSFEGQLGPGDYNLVVQTVDAEGAVLNKTEPVTLSVPSATQPTAVPVAAVQMQVPQITDSGNLTLTGTAPADATVDVLANGSSLGAVSAAGDGTWTFSSTLSPGEYTLVARALDATGAVISESVAASVTVPDLGAATPPPPTQAAPPGQEHIVVKGDTLSKLALLYYGDVKAYTRIIQATNLKAAEDPSYRHIDDPNAVEVGDKLWIPDVSWVP